MVASYGDDAIKYFTALSPQPHRQEIIADLEKLAGECFSFYFEKRGTAPRRIIVYRDGIGEVPLASCPRSRSLPLAVSYLPPPYTNLCRTLPLQFVAQCPVLNRTRA